MCLPAQTKQKSVYCNIVEVGLILKKTEIKHQDQLQRNRARNTSLSRSGNEHGFTHHNNIAAEQLARVSELERYNG